MAYSQASRVAALIPNLLNSASDFTNLAVAHPASAQLVAWMSSGCALINARIQSLGYDVPIGSGVVIYDYLADLEATYAAYKAEQSRSSPRVAAGERTRANEFKKAFDSGLGDLAELDLTRMGVAYTGKWYVGGISESEKEDIESDTDRVKMRFTHGQFSNPDALRPEGKDEEEDD